MNGEEKIKKCAIEVLKELKYEVDEGSPFIEGFFQISETTEFWVKLNLGRQEFEEKYAGQIENPERYLDALNRRLKDCLNKS